MIDRLCEMSTRGQVLAWSAIAIGFIALAFAVGEVLEALGQDPLTWAGWALIVAAIAAPFEAAARGLIRHGAAGRASAFDPAPEWLHQEWFYACRAAGITEVPRVAQYAGIDGMARTMAGRFEHDDLLLVQPALAEHPRPLVRYTTLAVEAARLAGQLSTAPATACHAAGRLAEWSTLLLLGLAMLSDAHTDPLAAGAVVSMVTGAVWHLLADRGADSYLTADVIAHQYMGYRITDEIITAAEKAEAAGSWINGRFEPDLSERAQPFEDLPDPPSIADLDADAWALLARYDGPDVDGSER